VSHHQSPDLYVELFPFTFKVPTKFKDKFHILPTANLKPNQHIINSIKILVILDSSSKTELIQFPEALKFLIEYTKESEFEMTVLSFIEELFHFSLATIFICFNLHVKTYFLERASNPDLMDISLTLFFIISQHFFSIKMLKDMIKTLKPNPDGSMSSRHEKILSSFFLTFYQRNHILNCHHFLLSKHLDLDFEEFQ
jgi:hypothetical protein